MNKYYNPDVGVVRSKKKLKEILRTHISYMYDVSGVDMRKIHKDEPLPYFCRKIFKSDVKYI